MLSAFTVVVCPALIHTVGTACPDRFGGNGLLADPTPLTLTLMPESARARPTVTGPLSAAARIAAVCCRPAPHSCLMTQTRKNNPPITHRSPANPVESSAAVGAGTDTGALTGLVAAASIRVGLSTFES